MHTHYRTLWAALAIGLAICSGCSGGGSGNASGAPVAVTPQPPPVAPPPATNLISPTVLFERPVATDLYGYNFNVLRAADVLARSDFRASLRTLRASTLRIPGGTVGEYWSWQRGGLLAPPYQGLPEGPPFSSDQLAITGATPELVDATLDAAGASAFFAINALTADLATNIADLQRFQALGQPIRALEIGNEEYFRTPNNTARFPTASAYAIQARDWSTALKATFPTAKTGAIAPSPVRQTGISFVEWAGALDAANAWSTLDAITIHPYAEVTFPVADQSNAQAVGAVATLIAADDTYLDAVRARIPTSSRIWITEWNTNDSMTAPVFAGSWIHALSGLARAMNFIDHTQVDYVLQHVVLGDRQWQAMTGPDGRIISYANGQSFTATITPFTLTASGRAMALLGDAMREGGRAMRLGLVADERATPLFGYRIAQPDGDVLTLLVNASDREAQVSIGGRAKRLSASAWSAPVTTQEVNETIVQIAAPGLTLPAFSAALVDERGTSGLF